MNFEEPIGEFPSYSDPESFEKFWAEPQVENEEQLEQVEKQSSQKPERTVQKLDRYDLFRDMIKNFIRTLSRQKLQAYNKLKKDFLKDQHKSLLWVFSNLAFFEHPILQDDKQDFVKFINCSFKFAIGQKVKKKKIKEEKDRKVYEQILVKSLTRIVNAIEMCFCGKIEASLDQAYKTSETNNNSNHRYLSQTLEMYGQIKKQVKAKM